MNYLSYIVPYIEYFCVNPIRYISCGSLSNFINYIDDTDDSTNMINSTNTIDISDTDFKISTLNIVNETTKQKVFLQNIIFDKANEKITIFENDTKDEYMLESIVRNVISILGWNTENEVIIVSNQNCYISYGVEYFCIRNNKNEIIDICTKNNNEYVSILYSKTPTKEYNYFDLIKKNENMF